MALEDAVIFVLRRIYC